MDEIKGVSPLVNPATRYRHTDGSERGVERRVACENGFRRGGKALAHMAVEAMLEGFRACDGDIDALAAKAAQWLERVDKWRASVDELGTMVLPPAFEEDAQ